MTSLLGEKLLQERKSLVEIMPGPYINGVTESMYAC